MILNRFLSLLTSILFLGTDWSYEMSVSKGIFMCLLLGVIKIADMNVNAKIWFPGQQIKPLGGVKHKSSLFVYKSPNCWSSNRCTKKIFSGKVYLHPRINSRPKNPDLLRVLSGKLGKTEK